MLPLPCRSRRAPPQVRSYQVECAFYRPGGPAQQAADQGVQLPRALLVEATSRDSFTLVLTDLRPEFPCSMGRNLSLGHCKVRCASTRCAARMLALAHAHAHAHMLTRPRTCRPPPIQAALEFLAHFHATFWEAGAERGAGLPTAELPSVDLWPQGTFWHLATRQEELEAMGGPCTAWCCTARHGTARHCMARRSASWHGTARHSTRPPPHSAPTMGACATPPPSPLTHTHTRMRAPRAGVAVAARGGWRGGCAAAGPRVAARCRGGRGAQRCAQDAGGCVPAPECTSAEPGTAKCGRVWPHASFYRRSNRAWVLMACGCGCGCGGSGGRSSSLALGAWTAAAPLPCCPALCAPAGARRFQGGQHAVH